MNWGRAVLGGMLGALMLALFINIFNMAGVTPFSLEKYLGSLVTGRPELVHSWTIGFFLNLIVGGVFGIFYAYFFEYVYKSTDPKHGALVGLFHAVAAAVAFFPFFEIAHEEMGTNLFASFGFFGSGLGAATPLILLVGHMLFGLTMGLVYGPVRLWRLHARAHEPGESGLPGEPGVITEAQDPLDRASGY